MRRAQERRGERGFIIVAVLWILIALAALTSAFAVYAGNSAVAARLGGDRLQADALTSAGLELAALRLLAESADNPRSSGEFQFQMGGATVVTRFRSEGGRVDLNAAPKELLAGLFTTLGAKPDDAGAYADRIIGWRKKPEGPQNKEADLYKDAGLKYLPRQSPFQNIAELRFVLGIPPDMVAAATPFVTLFNGSPQIDVLTAPPEVLESLPHIQPDTAKAILDRRGTDDPKAILSLLGPAADSVSIEPRKAARVNVAIALKGRRRVNVETVILVGEKDNDPYRVLAWGDDFDGAF